MNGHGVVYVHRTFSRPKADAVTAMSRNWEARVTSRTRPLGKRASQAVLSSLVERDEEPKSGTLKTRSLEVS